MRITKSLRTAGAAVALVAGTALGVGAVAPVASAPDRPETVTLTGDGNSTGDHIRLPILRRGTYQVTAGHTTGESEWRIRDHRDPVTPCATGTTAAVAAVTVGAAGDCRTRGLSVSIEGGECAAETECAEHHWSFTLERVGDW
ncbi:MAG: hypothetical protein OXG44_20640 [Gammaproteobacteria bacterium]|nr:hypothetical protein [Gammaproteobacteria bacterium]